MLRLAPPELLLEPRSKCLSFELVPYPYTWGPGEGEIHFDYSQPFQGAKAELGLTNASKEPIAVQISTKKTADFSLWPEFLTLAPKETFKVCVLLNETSQISLLANHPCLSNLPTFPSDSAVVSDVENAVPSNFATSTDASAGLMGHSSVGVDKQHPWMRVTTPSAPHTESQSQSMYGSNNTDQDLIPPKPLQAHTASIFVEARALQPLAYESLARIAPSLASLPPAEANRQQRERFLEVWGAHDAAKSAPSRHSIRVIFTSLGQGLYEHSNSSSNRSRKSNDNGNFEPLTVRINTETAQTTSLTQQGGFAAGWPSGFKALCLAQREFESPRVNTTRTLESTSPIGLLGTLGPGPTSGPANGKIYHRPTTAAAAICSADETVYYEPYSHLDPTGALSAALAAAAAASAQAGVPLSEREEPLGCSSSSSSNDSSSSSSDNSNSHSKSETGLEGFAEGNDTNIDMKKTIENTDKAGARGSQQANSSSSSSSSGDDDGIPVRSSNANHSQTLQPGLGLLQSLESLGAQLSAIKAAAVGLPTLASHQAAAAAAGGSGGEGRIPGSIPGAADDGSIPSRASLLSVAGSRSVDGRECECEGQGGDSLRSSHSGGPGHSGPGHSGPDHRPAQPPLTGTDEAGRTTINNPNNGNNSHSHSHMHSEGTQQSFHSQSQSQSQSQSRELILELETTRLRIDELCDSGYQTLQHVAQGLARYSAQQGELLHKARTHTHHGRNKNKSTIHNHNQNQIKNNTDPSSSSSSEPPSASNSKMGPRSQASANHHDADAAAAAAAAAHVEIESQRVRASTLEQLVLSQEQQLEAIRRAEHKQVFLSLSLSLSLPLFLFLSLSLSISISFSLCHESNQSDYFFPLFHIKTRILKKYTHKYIQTHTH
jgi:hypothetical protein